MGAEFYSAKILLIEDDFDLAANIVDYLGRRGYLVHHAMNSGLALIELTEGNYDAILLDVRLPGMNGLALCQHIRKGLHTDIPILMITAADSLEDRLAGFNAGTDDYVVKPFALPEIEARLRSLLRRAGKVAGTDADTVSFGSLNLHVGQMLATRNGEPLEITTMGFRILLQLARAAPNIVDRRDLEEAIWKDEPPGSDAMRSHIFALRKVLDKPFAKPMLRTIRGVGYQLVRD